MSDDRRIVICVPTARMTDPVDGSVARWCDICGAEVWAAMSTLRMLDRYPGTTVVCNDCAPGVAATEDEVQVFPVAPEEVEHNPHYRATLEAWRRRLGRKKR
jgi:hypothetical protein